MGMSFLAFMNPESKLCLSLGVLRKDPVEFWDRLHNFIEVRRDRLRAERRPQRTIHMGALIAALREKSNWDLNGPLQETAMEEIEHHVSRLASGSDGNKHFDRLYDADLTLARLCYAICRVLSPNAVVETGVANGVTTSFILQALAQNGRGKLWSIDLPPIRPQADLCVGLFVPQELRANWELGRGVSKRLLPSLLDRLHTVDLFIHDSLHTRLNMGWEFEAVWPHLRPGGVLIADDVQSQPAFLNFVSKTHPFFSAIVTEKSKSAAFGMVVKANENIALS